MIYSFSPDAKLEWFPSPFYPPEDKTANKRRFPGGPRNKYEWSDGFVEGFPIGTEFNELVQFDLRAYANHDVDDYSSRVNSDILQWEEQECTRLELKRIAPEISLRYGPFRKIHKGLKLWEPPTRYCDKNVFLELPDIRLYNLRWHFSAIENKLIAENYFQRNSAPSDVSLWVLSQLDYYRIRRGKKSPDRRIVKSADKIELLISYIADFFSLHKVLQTAESFRLYCEKELRITFRSCLLPQFEKAFIALLEATLEILKEDSLYYAAQKKDIDVWINARTVDLIQLCGSRGLGGYYVSLTRLRNKHRVIIEEFSNLETSLEEKGLLSDEARLYIGLAKEVGECIEFRAKELEQQETDKTKRRPTLRDLEKYKVEIGTDFHIATAIATSKVLANTFSAYCIEELIAYMAYASIKQGDIPRVCPNCQTPFIKVDNAQAYCTTFCRVEHAKVPEGKKSPAKIRDNIRKKAWKKPESQIEPKQFCVYFRCLIGVLNMFWEHYQESDSIDAATFNAWARALNCFKANHLEYDGNVIKCVYGKDNKGYKNKIDPLVPLIIDNQLVALSLKVENENTQQYVDKLCSAIDRYVAKGKGKGVTNCQKLGIIKECKKGNVKEELSSLIALGDEQERNRPMER